MFTIPPRQRLSFTRRLAIRARHVTRSSTRRIKSIPRFVFCKTIRHSSRASEKMKSSNNKQHKLFHIIRETKALWRSYTHTHTHKRAVFTHARAHKESRENFARSFLSSCFFSSLNPKELKVLSQRGKKQRTRSSKNKYESSPRSSKSSSPAPPRSLIAFSRRIQRARTFEMHHPVFCVRAKMPRSEWKRSVSLLSTPRRCFYRE